MEVLFPLAIFLAVIFLGMYLRKQGYAVKATETHLVVTRKPKAAIAAPEFNDWDNQFLKAEAAKHTVDRIEDAEVFYVSERDNPNRRLMDGFNCFCACGDRVVALNLKDAERKFKEHQEKKREAALARLGRFK